MDELLLKVLIDSLWGIDRTKVLYELNKMIVAGELDAEATIKVLKVLYENKRFYKKNNSSSAKS
jgi:hypothetical protein